MPLDPGESKHCETRRKRNKLVVWKEEWPWYEMSDVYLCGRPSDPPPTSRQYVNNQRSGWAPIRNRRMSDEMGRGNPFKCTLD